jgi:hypothetical protein
MQRKWWLRPEFIQIAAALCALFLGLMMYLFSRDPHQVYFLENVPTHFDTAADSNKAIDSLPSFLHVYSFILLTSAVLSASLTTIRIICVFWFSIECLFEIGQYHAISYHITNHVPAWFADVPILKLVPAYFVYGTFDVVDIIAMLLGVCAAYITAVLSQIASERSTQ